MGPVEARHRIRFQLHRQSRKWQRTQLCQLQGKSGSDHHFLSATDDFLYEPPYKWKSMMKVDSGKREIYQQFINAQHDVYHTPDMSRWLKYPAYVFGLKKSMTTRHPKKASGRNSNFHTNSTTAREIRKDRPYSVGLFVLERRGYHGQFIL